MQLKVRDDYEMELSELRDLKAAADLAQEKFRDQQRLVSAMMKDRELKTTTTGGYRYTLVQTETTSYDEAKLRKALGAAAFNKLTKRVLDKSKLTKAVQEGQLDVVVLAQSANISQGAPFVRVSQVTNE